MKSIYSNAEAVQIWLGEPIAGSDDAIAMLKELGRGLPLDDVRIQDVPMDDSNWVSLIVLTRRPCWERTWVQQELLLAKTAILNCGSNRINWSNIPSHLGWNSMVFSGSKSLQIIKTTHEFKRVLRYHRDFHPLSPNGFLS